MIVNTVLPVSQSLHPKFQRGMHVNHALLSLSLVHSNNHMLGLYEGWNRNFENKGGGFYSIGRAEDIFIGIQNNLVLPPDTLSKFLYAFETEWRHYDILFYSNLNGTFNLDTCINDAFFIMRQELVNRIRWEFNGTDCPLCTWFAKFRTSNYTMDYYCQEQLEVAEPTILIS